MRLSVVTIVYLLVTGMAKAYAATETIPFSLEYCPATPSPINIKGEKQGAVTAKYAPSLTRDFNLYIGSGLAYSLPSTEVKFRDQHDADAGIKTGVAGQAGIDYKLSEHASMNLDYKYLRFSQDPVRSNNETSPQLFGLSLRCNF